MNNKEIAYEYVTELKIDGILINEDYVYEEAMQLVEAALGNGEGDIPGLLDSFEYVTSAGEALDSWVNFCEMEGIK